MDYSKDELKKYLEDIIKGLEEAKKEKELEWDFYATLFPEELSEECDGDSPDDDFGRAAAAHPELHPLMRRLVDLVTEINNTIKIQWFHEETHAAAGVARQLALVNQEDILLYSRYLSSNDLNHEVYQAEDIEKILDKWGSCKESYVLAAARWFTPGQHRHEQRLEDYIEVPDEKAADDLIAMTAKWFIEAWFEPYSPKGAGRHYFEAHVKENVEEFFQMFLPKLVGEENIPSITENFTDSIYAGKTPRLKDLLHGKESSYLKNVPQIKESVPVIIDKNEMKKRGLEKGDIEKEDKPKFFLFYDYQIPDPFIRGHIEEQWALLEGIGGDGQRWNHYRSFKLGEYYVDLVNAPCNYGLVLYDGEHEPLVLYGVLDYAAIIKKYFGTSRRWSKGTLGDAEKRKEILDAQTKYVMYPPPRQSKKAIVQPKYEIHYDLLYDAIIEEKDWDKALELFKGVDKNGEEYPAAVIDKLTALEGKQNWAEASETCDELLELLPEYSDYWKQKKESFQRMS